MHLAPMATWSKFAASIIFKFNFADFFLFTAHRLITQDDSVRQLVMRVVKERKKVPSCLVLPIPEDIAY